MIFPGCAERVFADWLTGRLRVPQGRLLECIHAGYASRYERDLILDIDRGVLVGTETAHNEGTPEPDGESREIPAFLKWLSSLVGDVDARHS